MGVDQTTELNTDEVVYCARHPKVETVLRCGRCNTPICPRCLIQTPVGARCRDCANVRTLPTVDVSLSYLARGIGAALVAGIVVGAAWGFISQGASFVGFFILFIGIGIGWAIGESVSAATNRRRATALQACAVLGCLIAFLVRNIIAVDALLPIRDPWSYIAVALAAFYSASRVRGG